MAFGMSDNLSQSGDDNAACRRRADMPTGSLAFEKFRIVKKIGEGGMGAVYEVKEVNLDKTMALKILHARLGNDVATLRFQNEARNACRLSHPSIVAVYDFGQSDGMAYMSQELVEGENLQEFVRKNKCLSLEQFVVVISDICDALEVAHRQGVIHRDIKPGNIIVSERNGQLSSKVLDFGLSKRFDLDEQQLLKLTLTGQVLGTPLYMSPEQADGRKITHSADLYALGCVMYFSLAGKPPFKGDTAIDTISMHCSAAPPLLRQSATGEELPERLIEIVDRLLSKEPGERYSSAAAVKEQLHNIAQEVDDDSSNAQPESQVDRVRWEKSNGSAADALGLDAQSSIQTPFENLTSSLIKRHFLLTLTFAVLAVCLGLVALSGERGIDSNEVGTNSSRSVNVSQVLNDIEDTMSVDPTEILNETVTEVAKNQSTQAKEHYLVFKRHCSLSPQNANLLAKMEYQMGLLFKKENDFAQAQKHFEKADKLVSRFAGDQLTRAEAICQAGDCLHRQNLYDEALDRLSLGIPRLEVTPNLLGGGGTNEHAREVLLVGYHSAADILIKKRRRDEAQRLNLKGIRLNRSFHHSPYLGQMFEAQRKVLGP